jgi:hypothetical protein
MRSLEEDDPTLGTALAEAPVDATVVDGRRAVPSTELETLVVMVGLVLESALPLSFFYECSIRDYREKDSNLTCTVIVCTRHPSSLITTALGGLSRARRSKISSFPFSVPK